MRTAAPRRPERRRGSRIACLRSVYALPTTTPARLARIVTTPNTHDTRFLRLRCRRVRGSSDVRSEHHRIFADGADLDRHPGARRRSAHLRVHDEPDADAQGRAHRLRGVRAAAARAGHRHSRSPSRSSPTTPTRCAARRSLIAVVGRERLRQDPGHHDERRVDRAARARALRGRREGQRHGAVHDRPGRD